MNSGKVQFDVSELKRRAPGRWPEILTFVAGIPRELLDGKHHGCPKCGGKDRFRFIDGEAGAVFCNQCFKEKNGDGIAAVKWMRDISFVEAIERIAHYLGLVPQSGQLDGNSLDPLAAVCQAKRMPRESAVAYGAKTESGAVVFPMFGPDGKPCSEFTIRVIGGSADKGLNAKGKKAGVFLPVINGQAQLPRAGEVWLVVEGVKDSVALRSLGYWAMGMPTSELAQKFVKLLHCVHVVLIPDRDSAGIGGAETTARRLYGVAASVKIAALPVVVTEKNGKDVRDILAQQDGERLVREAIETALEWRLPENKGEDKATIRRLADAIMTKLYFAQDRGKKLYVFRDGAYRPRGDDAIRQQVKALCQEWSVDNQWSSHLANEVIEYIRVDSPELWERPPMDVMNVKNGILRIADRVLLKHTSEHLSTVQLPVTYDKDAKCPETEKFAGQVFPADAVSLAWEIPAYLMRPATSIQKAILLLGPGGNGKSTWLAQLLAFLGKGNTSNKSLHKLEADKFAAAQLFGKLANICPDLPSEHLAGTSVFKAITGGDPITGEYKFKDSFDFIPFCRLAFSANTAPMSKDSSQGFFERWLVIPFERSFRCTAAEIPRHVLDARLASPIELSGLLNKALDALPTISKGFSNPASVAAAWQEFHSTTDPLAVWLDRFTIDDPQAFTVTKSLRVAFNAAMERQGRPAMSDTAFGLSFAKLRPNVETKQRTVKGRLQRCYIGIALHDDRPDDSHPSQGSRGSPSINQSHGKLADHEEWEAQGNKIEQTP